MNAAGYFKSRKLVREFADELDTVVLPTGYQTFKAFEENQPT